jgi:hypothetical protein
MKHALSKIIGFTPIVTVTVAVAVTAVCASVAAAAGMRKVEVADPQYQMTAYTVEIPASWKFAGTIARVPGCHGNGAAIKYTAQSTDGLSALVVMPGAAWSWASSPTMQKSMQSTNCAAIDIDSAASFLVNIVVPNLRPDAKVVAMLPLKPEGQAALAEQLDQARQQNAAMARQFGQQPQKLSLDGATVRLQYARDGHAVEETITAVVDCTESQMAAMFGQPAYRRRSCSARSEVVMRAPQGHLEELTAQFKDLTKTVQVNPDWQSKLLHDQQAAFQKLDRQEFKNPNTGQTIEASSQYNHQWISSDGSTLIQTNDHSYDPNGQVYPGNQSWSELVPK